MPEPAFKLPPREAYKCRFCDKTYATPIGVNQHERNHHREQVAASPRFERGPLIREVLRRMRLRLAALDPAPVVELKAIDNFAFITELADDRQEHGLDASSDARWSKIAERYGIRRQDPGLTSTDLALLLARDDLNKAERMVLEDARDSLTDLFGHFESKAMTVHDVMVGQCFDGSHRWRF